MKQEVQEKLFLFAENSRAAMKAFLWQDTLATQLSALMFAQEGKPVDCEGIKECMNSIKKNTGVFSSFRSDMSMFVATLMCLSDRRDKLFEGILNAYEALKGAKFSASDHLVAAACQLALNEDADSAVTVSRARSFFDAMKKSIGYTGTDDYVFIVMLALSKIDVLSGAERIERLYELLKPEFRDKNSAQALAQILVLGGESDEAEKRLFALRYSLKSRKIPMDRSDALPMLGVLALLPEDAGEIAQDVYDAQSFLRGQKGLGAFSITAQDLLLFSSSIALSGYAQKLDNVVASAAISASIASIFIAQQAAMIASMSACFIICTSS
ncbi:MAG: DUF4003 domain-containing protein [Clostridiales bacterium]|nr:DUF4003 domain-containing protein [Clostridiales bacterium]